MYAASVNSIQRGRQICQCPLIDSHWFISDLIPKKSKKLEFPKNFATIFFSVKNWPIKQNFEIFRLRNFSKEIFLKKFQTSD